MKKKIVYMILVIIFVCGIYACSKKEEEMISVNSEQIMEREENVSESTVSGELIENKNNNSTESPNKNEEANEEIKANEDISNQSKIEQESFSSQLETIIEGTQMMDGQELPVNVTFKISNIQSDNEAYSHLFGENTKSDIAADMEYIIVTFDITYNEGNLDEIYLAENDSTLQSAKLKFSLSDGDSNAEDVTSYLENSIYNLVIQKGETGQGAVAFLHKKDSTEPLWFSGFGNTVSFALEK